MTKRTKLAAHVRGHHTRIAAMYGCSRPTVSATLAGEREDPELLRWIERYRDELHRRRNAAIKAIEV